MVRLVPGGWLVAASLASAPVFADGGAQAEPAAASPPAAHTSERNVPQSKPPEARAPEESDGSRFRFGISAFGGPFASGATGGAGGLDVRLGSQLNNLFGIYAQPVLLAGAGTAAGRTGAGASAVAMVGLGVLADFTFFDLVYVGAGPEALVGAAANVGAGAGSNTLDVGGFLSVAARAGLAFGNSKPKRRSAFTIGLDFRSIFATNTIVLPGIALGYESF
jgi:hypothetical protein